MNKTFIIAELSANHNHKKEIALESIKAAKESDADAVKIQTYTADTLTLDCDNEYFQIKQGTLWDGATLYKLYQQAYTPWEWHKELFEYAKKLDIPLFSTPFDKTAVDFLEELNNPIIKIASFELVDIPLIEYAASKGKPMIMSTGIATLQEIQEAVDACHKAGNNDITLLKCTSSYPAPLNEANLMTIPDMKKRFGCKVGLSDHTTGNIAACTAVALGAKVIEKHFIIDRSIGGPDASFSMTKEEFAEMVRRVRETEGCLGSVKPSDGCHLADGDYASELDSHLHYGAGSFSIRELIKLVPESCMITNEAKRSIVENLFEFKVDSEFIRKIC